MWEKEPQLASPKNPVHDTTDIAIKNLSNLSLEQCHEVVNYLKDYLADRKNQEMTSIKCQIEDLQSHSNRLNELKF